MSSSSSSDVAVSAAGPADLIAAVWYTLGFRPLNSLVLVALHGRRGRVGAMLRIDLTPCWFGPAGVSDVLDAAIDALTSSAFAASCAPGQPRVVVVVAAQDALSPSPSPVIRALPQALARAGVRLFDVIGVTPARFRSLNCQDQACCPPGGRPLSEVESSRVAVAHVLRGDRLADTEEDLIGDVGDPVPTPAPASGQKPAPAQDLSPGQGPVPDQGSALNQGSTPDRDAASNQDVLPDHGSAPGQGPAVERAREPERMPEQERAAGRGAIPVAEPEPVAERELGPGDAERVRHRWWRTWNALLGRTEGWSVDQLDLAPLGDSYLRDAIFVRLAAIPGATRIRFLRQLLSGETPPDLSERWEFLFGDLPDRDLVARGEEILAELARRGTAAERGPVLGVLALLAWYRGNGVRTRLLVDRMRRENPDPERSLPQLAGLVELLSVTGAAPPWVEARDGGEEP